MEEADDVPVKTGAVAPLHSKVRPRITHTFALEEIAEVHRLLESRSTVGKIVLRP
jgi:NADPH:quinone reductase-like Zn-dependent oxidoreductase